MTDMTKARDAAITALRMASLGARGWDNGFDAVLASLRQSGLVLVPVKPTEGMVRGGAGESWAHSADYSTETNSENATAIYTAMLEACERESK